MSLRNFTLDESMVGKYFKVINEMSEWSEEGIKIRLCVSVIVTKLFNSWVGLNEVLYTDFWAQKSLSWVC